MTDLKFNTGKSYQNLMLETLQINDKINNDIRSLNKEFEKNITKIEFYKQMIANEQSEFKIGEMINYCNFGSNKIKVGFISAIKLSSFLENVIYYISDENGKKIHNDTVQTIYKL
jgi:hypothetical protein